MKNKKFMGVAALFLALGLVACGGGSGSEEGPSTTSKDSGTTSQTESKASSEKHVHTFDETKWEHDDSKHWHPATCEHTTQKGSSANHDLVKDEAKSTPATCEAAGKTVSTCSVCGAVVEKEEKALGHSWKEFPEYEGTLNQATCTTAGQVAYKCETCGQTKVEDSQALGHNMKEVGDPIVTEGKVTLQKFACERCGAGTEYRWSAADLAEGSSPKEAEPTATSGVTFGDYSIGNDLKASEATQESHTSIPNPDQQGSSLIYNIKLPLAMAKPVLKVEMTQNQWSEQDGVYAFGNSSGDWTPGLKPDGSKYEGVRYVVKLNGTVIDFPEGYQMANDTLGASQRGWLAFPIELPAFTEGQEITISLHKAGGYENTHYSFALADDSSEPAPVTPTPVDPSHQHAWVDGTAAANADGKNYIPMTCSCGKVGVKIAVKDFSSAGSATFGTDGKMSTSQTAAGTVWKVKAPKAGTYALYIDAKFSSGTGDNKKFSERGVTIKVNDTAVTYDDSITAEAAGFNNATTAVATFADVVLTGNEDSIEITNPFYRMVFNVDGFISFIEK